MKINQGGWDMKEFNLSEKIEHNGWLDITYVKEFIRLLKENIEEVYGKTFGALYIIDKLAGEDLK